MEALDLGPSAFLDLSRSLAAPIFLGLERVWEAIPLIAARVAELVAEPPPGYRRIAEGIIAHEGAVIARSAELLGPAVIGRGAEVGPGAWIRASVIVGDFAQVGHASELKNCVLFEGALAPHFNYVGDSLVGVRAHLGAGSILSNQRSDKGEVLLRGLEGLAIPTGLPKFGAVLGDGVEIGCNAVCFPGTIVGRGSTIYPLAPARGLIPAESIVKSDGTVTARRGGVHG